MRTCCLHERRQLGLPELMEVFPVCTVRYSCDEPHVAMEHCAVRLYFKLYLI